MVNHTKNKLLTILKEKTLLSNQECSSIADIIATNKIVGRKNKEKIINDIMSILSFDRNKANEIYNICMEIIVLNRF